MFPNGWPGNGLLLLRLISGTLAIYDGITVLMGAPHREPVALLLLAAAAGVLLIVGFWTPVAGVVLALGEAPVFLFDTDHSRGVILLIAVGVSLAMLGPGVWSIDAILFGRKRLNVGDL